METKFVHEPLLDRIVLRPVAKENKTAGGLILPTGMNDNSLLEYDVVAVGEGTTDSHTKLKVGDKVLCHKDSGIGYEVKEGDNMVVYLIVRFHEPVLKLN